MSFMIGTPAYGGMMHCNMVDQLLRYQHVGLAFSLMTVGNESLITRARNSIVSEFHARREHSHLLFLDADVVLPVDGLQRMLAAGVDVVGAAVALKGRNPDGSRKFNLGRTTGEAGSLIRVQRVGTAALLLSRDAVNALVEKAIAEGRVYRRSSNLRGEDQRAAVHYDIFRVGVVGDEYLSEDYWVCHELRELGFEVHVDPTLVTRHLGMVEV
ncbi:MAG: hypothetical protein V2J19_08050 [Wenzhouxiangella sp.]|jgi:hypothetical protein|nr:hypothetical protein [Wenzhouxiangella sp.]